MICYKWMKFADTAKRKVSSKEERETWKRFSGKQHMGINSIIALLGGLGAFLFGMKYMGEGLELAAGSKMKDLLEKLTRNRIKGFLLGALVTVVIQSSSATTVMVMGFINAEIMDLAQATGVIFGANIGTTITSVLIALDVSCLYLYGSGASALRKKEAHALCRAGHSRIRNSVSGASHDELRNVSAERFTGISEFYPQREKSAARFCGRSCSLCCNTEFFCGGRRSSGAGHAGTDAALLCSISDLRYQRRFIHTAAAFCIKCKK